MPIHTLSEQVSSAIAAGEVVERPASVVKELLENSLDAGAKTIEIQFRAGGRELIEVFDDGHGIAAEEIELAVSRFATSKISGLDDLHAIQTLGFRGEALASIAAVSRLEITSRAPAAQAAVRLEVASGKGGRPQKVGAPPGTTVRVLDLFYNVPARLKFLKSDVTERRWITKFVTRYALAHPGVRFRLSSGDRGLFHSSGRGDRREVLSAIYGAEVARQFLPLDESPQAIPRVAGYIGAPEVSRANRGEITLFVNGRWIQDVRLTTAVVQAYHGMMMVGRFPLAALFLEIPPSEVDVNVHPAKSEVRLRNPDAVYTLLQRSVRSTLLNRWAGPSLVHDPLDSDRGHQRWTDWGLAPAGDRPLAVDRGREILPANQARLPEADLPLLRAIGQVGASYLVAEGPDGVYLVDQHAAHERVLFERLMAQVREGTATSQALLEGMTVELPPHQAPLMQENLALLNKLGFDIEPFGTHAFRLRSVPAVLSGIAPDRAVWAVVDDFEEDESPLAGELEAKLAARVCKTAAVKAGQVLTLKEQEQLLRDLESCQIPRSCPHGRPTMIHLSVAALERQFGRRS